MERLAFDIEVPYSGLEAAVHLARYAIARPLCGGKRVLDVACGEGYGSRLLRDWGASEVEGVDVSQPAVDRANRLFAVPGLRYSVLDATHVDQAFAGRQFDLIVSIETIEHLPDPAAFLRAISRLLAPGGHVILTCPNDWWYYPTDAEANPYHLRKYRHDEFMALAQSVLGTPAHAGIGAPVAGFVNVALTALDEPTGGRGQLRMMDSRPVGGSFVVPMERPGGPTRDNCSYFFAVWGPVAEHDCGAAMLPVSMDIFRNGMYAGPLQEEVASLRVQLSQTQAALKAALAASDASIGALTTQAADLSERLRESQLRFASVAVENELMYENLARISAELDAARRLHADCEAYRHALAIAAYRYERLRALVPAPLLRLLRAVRDRVRRRRPVDA